MEGEGEVGFEYWGRGGVEGGVGGIFDRSGRREGGSSYILIPNLLRTTESPTRAHSPVIASDGGCRVKEVVRVVLVLDRE